jgi:membrane associated rhomboid family serine protease
LLKRSQAGNADRARAAIGMIFPINTDAPIYYRPWGTVGLILSNIIVFVATSQSPELMESLSLQHGQGLTPLAWLSSNFVHGGFVHLLGNMLFLWGFGLIVEGKLGWHRFLSIYLLIGIVECAVEQLLFPSWVGISFGASAVIFGLMAISLIWAPKNDLTVFYWFAMRIGTFDLPILWFSLLFIGKSIAVYSFVPGTEAELLHLLGALIGVAVAMFLLLGKHVDCEGWDLLSVVTGRVPRADAVFSWESQADLQRRKNQRTARRKRKTVRKALAPSPANPERFRELVQKRKILAAHGELVKIRQWKPEFTPEADEALCLARGLRQIREWAACVEMYEQVLQRRPDFSPARLELAELLVLIQERPRAARRILQDCDIHTLSPRQASRLEVLNRQIEGMIADGVIELEGRAG